MPIPIEGLSADMTHLPGRLDFVWGRLSSFPAAV